MFVIRLPFPLALDKRPTLWPYAYNADHLNNVKISQDGFLKAFSDDPEHFNATMTPLQTCMKMLSLRRVTLRPRFVSQSVKRLLA